MIQAILSSRLSVFLVFIFFLRENFVFYISGFFHHSMQTKDHNIKVHLPIEAFNAVERMRWGASPWYEIEKNIKYADDLKNCSQHQHTAERFRSAPIFVWRLEFRSHYSHQITFAVLIHKLCTFDFSSGSHSIWKKKETIFGGKSKVQRKLFSISLWQAK